MSKWVDSLLTCSSCNLFFSSCERVQSCLNLKAPNIAPVTCQAAAMTVSVVPGTTFSSESIFSSFLGKYGKLLLDEPSSCSRISDLDSGDIHFVCCCTGMNIPTINYIGTCPICKLQYLGISEYISDISDISHSTFKFFYVTRSNLSHSPEDAVILTVLRGMSLSTPVFSWTSSLHSPTFAIHHPPTP